MTSTSSQQFDLLLNSTDYREFMCRWIELRKQSTKFGFSSIARNAGFSARSFPRDVALGKKRLTLNSLPKIIKGLRLTGDLAEYFRILVEIEHEDCRTKSTDPLRLLENKARLATRIQARQGMTVADEDGAFEAARLPEVYAALGTAEHGATLDEILRRTKCTGPEIRAALEKMQQLGMIVARGQRYYSREAHISFEGLKKSDAFKKHFIRSSERSARMAKVGLSSDSKLFFSSAFSVNERDLPKLKEELRSVLLRFVDGAEHAEGSTVVNLVTSLF